MLSENISNIEVQKEGRTKINYSINLEKQLKLFPKPTGFH